MGLVIGYKGKLDDPSRLDETLDEIRKFCKKAGWRYKELTQHYSGVLLHSQEEADGEVKPRKSTEPWPDDMPEYGMRARVSKIHPPPFIEETCRGIIAYPRDTESLLLLFNPSGRLCHYMDLPTTIVYNALPDTVHYAAFPSWVKTTGAVESHIAICLLLKILKEKYIRKLKVSDDTGFFKTWNFKKLSRDHAQMSGLLSVFRDSTVLNSMLKQAGIGDFKDKPEIVKRVNPKLNKKQNPPAKRKTVH